MKNAVFWDVTLCGSCKILVTLMMEAIIPCEMSVLTRTTRRHITEDDILHSHRSENLSVAET
jgi:hypothetical protein